MNDFRWDPLGLRGGNIRWEDLLKLTEGDVVRLLAPMNHQSEHIIIRRDMPIFSTSREMFTFYVQKLEEPLTENHKVQNDMMKCRWNTVELKYQFAESEMVNTPACAACFCRLILDR